MWLLYWNSNTLATSCKELTHWQRPWCWEGLGAGGEGDDRGWDGWMASLTRWRWVWVSSRSWWPHVTQLRPQKLNEFGYQVLPHPPYSSDLSPTDYHFCKHLNNFLQGKHFHTKQEAENAFQDFTDSKKMDFYATGISNFISCWQNCVGCNGSYFD